MKNLCLCFIISVVFFSGSTAQTRIAEKAVKELLTCQNLSYNQTCRQRGPFSDEVLTFKLSGKIEISRDANVDNCFNIYDFAGYNTLSDGDKTLTLDVKNNSYTLIQGKVTEPYNTPVYWQKLLSHILTKSPQIIKECPDTAIMGLICHHIKLPLKNEKANYEIYDIYLDRVSYLPVYTRSYLQGKFGKGKMTSDILATMITENEYSKYVLNASKFPNLRILKIPAGFREEKQIDLIPIGKSVPAWTLLDWHGKKFSDSDFHGEITLMDFSFNQCAACELSLPMLKRLQSRYRDRKIKIISINVFDKKGSVQLYANKNHIKYPILIDGGKVGNNFQVTVFPTFYLLNGDGKILAGYKGYSAAVERDLVSKINMYNK